MKSFDWKRCLQKHHIFWDLSEEEIDKLLEDRISEELHCTPNDVIIKEGEEGDSVYLIGEGAISVVLTREDGPSVYISSFGKGEIFGEMAMFDQRQRSATVLAKEPSTLLEIRGHSFRELMEAHPNIEFKMAAKMSHRLREVTEHVLSARLHDVDQKLALFNSKLEAELRVIEASMKATQAVFDQTNKRANEVIESADRSRGRMTTTISAIGGVFGIVVAGLAFFGIEKAYNINQAITEVDNLTAEARERSAEIEEIVETMDQFQKDYEQFEEVRAGFYTKVMIPRFTVEILEKPEDARKTYRALLALEDPKVTHLLFKKVYRGLYIQETSEDYKAFLYEAVNLGFSRTDRQRVISYYLLLSTMLLDDDEKYGYVLGEFNTFAGNYSGASIRESLRTDFDPDTYMMRFGDEDKIRQGKFNSDIWGRMP